MDKLTAKGGGNKGVGPKSRCRPTDDLDDDLKTVVNWILSQGS
jgi:hypothetical protein